MAAGFLRSCSHVCLCTGVAWLLKRAQHARTLLIGELFGEALQDFALGLLQSPHSFTNLAALSLNREDNYRHKRTHEEAEALLMMWTWLAGQARQLQYLNLTLIQLKGLPRLPQLKHLQLHLKNGDCRRVAGCMTDALPSLQTLHIICHNDSQDDAPELLLAAMTQLRSLALRGVLPASLALPESTQLHVRVHDIYAARHPIWISLLPHLRTFHIDMQKEDSSFDAEENIPQFLFGPSSLETLIVSVSGFGTVKAPIKLRGSFLEVERLGIDTLDDIHVEVPTGHGWRLVNFHTCKSLGIRLHDMENFVDNRPEFSFQFTTLQGMGVMLLTRYMAERGVDWDWYDSNISYYAECYVHSPSDNAHDLLYLPANFERHNLFYLCRCQACWFCCSPWMALKATGVDSIKERLIKWS